MRQRRPRTRAVTLFRLRVRMPRQVGDLRQVIELIRHQRHERVPQLVGRPILRRQPRPRTQRPKRPPQVRHRHRRGVPRAEHEPLRGVQPDRRQLPPVAAQRGDDQRVQPDRAFLRRLRLGLPDVVTVDLADALCDGDRRLVRVDVDIARRDRAASRWFRSRSVSTRSTFRRDPSRNRTHPSSAVSCRSTAPTGASPRSDALPRRSQPRVSSSVTRLTDWLRYLPDILPGNYT